MREGKKELEHGSPDVGVQGQVRESGKKIRGKEKARKKSKIK